MDAADFATRLGGKGQLAVVTKTTQDVMLEPWLTSDVVAARVVPVGGASTGASTGTSTRTGTSSSSNANANTTTTTTNNNNNNQQLPSQPFAMLSAHIPHLHLSSLLGGAVLVHLEIAPLKNILLDRNLTSR